jgi:hypothetical protein
VAIQFRYGITLSRGTQLGLDYLNAGESGTLTVLVSNPGPPLGVQNIAFTFSIGPNATNLVASAGDITAIMPTGWIDLGRFNYAAPAGTTLDSTTVLRFLFTVNVNPLPGTTTFGILETTDKGQGAVTPAPTITKMPDTFTLANLVATPGEITRGATVTLTWLATPQQRYTIEFADGPADYTPTSAVAAWVSPPVNTSAQMYEFVVGATAQIGGQTLSAQSATAVEVDNPVIVSFPQPAAPFLLPPVTLQWQTSNADHCKLFSKGTLIDDNAPAHPPAAGYVVTPSKLRTPYSLYAVKGTTVSPGQDVTVLYAQWVEGTPVDYKQPRLAIALAPSGRTLYVQVNGNILALDAVSLQQLNSAQTYVGATPLGTLAPSDGAFVYAWCNINDQGHTDSVVYRYVSDGLAHEIGVSFPGPQAFAIQTGATMIYYTIGRTFIVGMYDALHPVHDYTFSTPGTAFSAIVSPDSSGMYFLRTSGTGTGLFCYHIASNSVTLVRDGLGGASGATPVFSANGATIHVPSADEHSIVPVDPTAGAAGTPIPIDASGRIVRMAIDDTSTVLFVAVAYATGGAVYQVVVASGALRKVATTTSSAIDIAIRPDGQALFIADGGTLRVLRLTSTADSHDDDAAHDPTREP